jgi:TRAP-type transport system small permease protein
VIDKLFERTARAIALTLALAFVFAVGLNFSNVVGRYVFGRSILWGDEVQIFIMVAITFLGAVVVTWRQQHLKMDVLVRMLPRPLRAAFKVLELILMLAICAFVFVQSQDYTLRMLDIGRTSDTAGVPMWIPHGSLALGFGLIMLVCLALGWRAIRSRSIGDETAQPRRESA